jgi:hypothetical protein
MLKACFLEKNTMNNVEERMDSWRDVVQKLIESPDSREHKGNDASPKACILICSLIIV